MRRSVQSVFELIGVWAGPDKRADTRDSGQDSAVIAAVMLQVGVLVGLSVVAWVGWSGQHAFHLLIGGLAAWVPNTLFAMRLIFLRGKPPESQVTVFFVGEFAKIALTVAFLFITVRSVPDLQWLPWLLGLIAAIKAPLLFGLRAF